MFFELLFDGCGSTRVRTAGMDRAIEMGHFLLQRGRQNVVIQSPLGGSTIALADVENANRQPASANPVQATSAVSR